MLNQLPPPPATWIRSGVIFPGFILVIERTIVNYYSFVIYSYLYWRRIQKNSSLGTVAFSSSQFIYSSVDHSCLFILCLYVLRIVRNTFLITVSTVEYHTVFKTDWDYRKNLEWHWQRKIVMKWPVDKVAKLFIFLLNPFILTIIFLPFLLILD